MTQDVERVRRAVAARAPVNDRESRAVARTLAELDRLAAPFDEHADPVHLTASAIVVGPRGTLLHRHKRLGIWLQPGGHVDPGEAPEDAAVRETTEETGVATRHPDDGPRLVHVDVHDGGRGHVHLDLRYLLVPAGADDEPDPAPGESPAVRWFDWDEAVAAADPGLVAALRHLRPHGTGQQPTPSPTVVLTRARRSSGGCPIRDG